MGSGFFGFFFSFFPLPRDSTCISTASKPAGCVDYALAYLPQGKLQQTTHWDSANL